MWVLFIDMLVLAGLVAAGMRTWVDRDLDPSGVSTPATQTRATIRRTHRSPITARAQSASKPTHIHARRPIRRESLTGGRRNVARVAAPTAHRPGEGGPLEGEHSKSQCQERHAEPVGGDRWLVE